MILSVFIGFISKQIHALQSYSWREFRKTRDVYSNKRDVFDKVSASLFGLEKANAVPTGD